MVAMRIVLWPAVCVQVLCVCIVARADASAAGVRAPRPVLDQRPVADETPRNSRPRIAVRVYSPATMNVETLQRALDLAQHTFGVASIDVVWTVCWNACATPPAPGQLLVRLAHASAGVVQNERSLGDAVIDVQTHTGVLATVYVDRVRQLADALDLGEGVLLGRTLAHEMAHLLMANDRHGAGLMRGIWSPRDLQRNRADDWTLSSGDAAAIRRHLAQALTATPSPTS